MKYSCRAIVLGLLVIANSGCGSDFSFVARNELSEHKKSERFSVTVLPERAQAGDVALPAVAAAVIPVLIEQGIKLVEKEIKREAERYVAEYSAVGIGDEFYLSEWDVAAKKSEADLADAKTKLKEANENRLKIEKELGTSKELPDKTAVKEVEARHDAEVSRVRQLEGEVRSVVLRKRNSTTSPVMRFQGVSLRRTVSVKGPDGKESKQVAIKFQMDAKQSLDGRFFRLIPALLEVPYAKCKVRSSDRDIDLEIRVTIDSYWVDEKGVSKAESVELPPVIVPAVPIGPQTDWTDAQREAVVEHLSRTPTTWIPMIPRSVTKTDNSVQYGLGTFAVRVKVKEFDDFGERVKSVGELVAKNKDDWVRDLTEASLGTKEDDQ